MPPLVPTEGKPRASGEDQVGLTATQGSSHHLQAFFLRLPLKLVDS